MVKHQGLEIVNAKLKAVDNLHLQLFDKAGKAKQMFRRNFLGKFLKNENFITGKYVDKLCLCNLVTNAGFAGASAIVGAIGTPDPYVYIALGTGTTAANVTDTTLETETAATGLARAAGTPSQTTTTVTNDTLTVIKTFTNGSGGSVAVTEAGLLNAASSGTLFARRVFSAVNVDDTDSLQATWNIKCSA